MKYTDLDSLIMEAIELLDESYGEHGLVGKMAEERYKRIKNNNDKLDDSNRHKYEIYKRAGYEDKAPAKVNRDLENRYKRMMDTDKKHSNGHSSLHTGPRYCDLSPSDKARSLGLHDIAKDLDNLTYQNVLPSKLHERINNRAKSQNESVSSINELRARLLIEASELLGE